jgi:hypothetical protein
MKKKTDWHKHLALHPARRDRIFTAAIAAMLTTLARCTDEFVFAHSRIRQDA